jgi:hypothetical protein
MEAADLSPSLGSGISHENPIVRENAEGKCLPTGSHKTGFQDIPARTGPLHGAVAELVGIEGGVVSGVFNLESSGVEALDWRPRHDEQYHEA